ncbi:oxidoreductase [Nocardioides euryhalodurans]|uniref:Oxidoreductase n=1 Tax=Nocardioides euryhalodurans TaxID=2518370 RepID=A0A4P7GLD1_9ACTN|nr:oxidoreductase [Nocardioides euryhalodurans]QBR92614.1 oxidoreductase [Nocardioides euryhalodurans]
MSTDLLTRLDALDGVPSAFAAARDGIDAMLRDRGLRRTSPETTAESLLRGAHASAVLEGSTSTLEEVRDGGGDEVARASVRLSTELLGLAPVLLRSPLQALARIHAVVGSGSLPADQLGRPRDAEAAVRLRAVGGLVSAEGSALLAAAVVHAELRAAQAFASHNGIVARAAERLVLVARGLDEKSLVVPEAGHLALRPAYEARIDGYREDPETGMHPWLLYAAEAYGAATEASPVRTPTPGS